MPHLWIRAAIAFWLALLPLLSSCAPATNSSAADSTYQLTAASADGIGKVYLGREIAQVMGHQGAAWLERSSRKFEESPDLAVDLLDLKPTDIVADIGAGTGYISFRIAPEVPEGKVLAVDLQPEMLDMLATRQSEQGVANVEPIQGAVDDPHLPPASLDLAIMVDAYHEFAYPQEMMHGIVKALKPGGRVVLAEYRAENPFILIKRLHKMSQKQVKKEMAAVGLVWQKTDDSLPQQHLMFFQKPV
ncbi:class I SAM-dependent methyltransferase [Almyronema epifaneia]|uniref:Class I SAM-dependent methyltransferase n=1 Tax=Almyronema epifaneia S1 TaxID=2991925 RepID=A0ABW6IEB6_9CYAN